MRDSASGRDDRDIDEVDLAIIHAVERSPRASWALIGSVVGVDASTAARRWERLSAAGIAWVTCYPLLGEALAPAIVEVTCAPDSARRVAELIARDPQALIVDITTGHADILVTAVADSISALSSYVLDRLGAIDGVAAVQTHPVLMVHSEGNLVGAGSLDPAALAQLPAPDHGELQLTTAAGRIDDLDWEICLALSRDGRVPLSTLSTQVGAGESTVRRRLAKLAKLGALRMMVEVAASRTPTPLIVWYSARIPAHRLAEAAGFLAALPNIKAVASVAGPDNLVFKATFHAPADLLGFDLRLSERLPEMQLTDRKLVLRPVRLMSRLLDAEGYARDIVTVDVRTLRPSAG